MSFEVDHQNRLGKFDSQTVLRGKSGQITEDGLALTFVLSEPTLRYVAAWDRWMVWQDSVWREDSTLAVYDRIRAHVRSNTDGVKDWLRANVIAAVERLAKSDRRYAATAEQWDADDWILNTPNGIIELKFDAKSSGDGEAVVTRSDPERYLTKQTRASLGRACPTWAKFLLEVTNFNADYVAFLQRVAGYCALGTIREHAMFFLYGGGANGKGTFLNTLQKVMGDYATVASMDTFTESKSERHPTELAMLRGARFVLAQETEEGRSWAESRIKSLTGGDPIAARYMRQDFFTFEPKFKLLIAGNHKPRLRNVDEAIRRRLHLLPFTKEFKDQSRDPDLGQKLLSESEGILGWIVNGAMAYQQSGLNPPPIVLDATVEYFSNENVFQQWLEDCCEFSPNLWERPAALFSSWKRYAENANEKIGTQKSFGDRLAGAGFQNGNSRGRGGRFWDGLKVRQAVQEFD